MQISRIRAADTGSTKTGEVAQSGGTLRVLLLVFVAATVKADRQRGGSVPHVAIVARVSVKEGRAGEYVAAFEPLLEQAKEEPGTLLYALHRSKVDPHVSGPPRSTPTMLLSQPTARAKCMRPPRRCSPS